MIEFRVEADTLTFLAEGIPIEPAEGMARMFGRFELIGRIPAIRSPGPEVLVYQPPARQARSQFAGLPPHVWLEAQPGLWLTHDGQNLLLAPTSSVMQLGA